MSGRCTLIRPFKYISNILIELMQTTIIKKYRLYDGTRLVRFGLKYSVVFSCRSDSDDWVGGFISTQRCMPYAG